MAKHKLRRFAELETFSNVIQPKMSFEGQDLTQKGKWKKEIFRNGHPITLELGCGRGEYTVYLAEHFKERNFIGIDIKGSRLWRGAKTAVEKEFGNAFFLRIEIEQITYCFEKDEVDEIWITFPDPQLQISRERKRLTSTYFTSKYEMILKKGGIINLKTDSKDLYDYTLSVIAEEKFHLHTSIEDIYNEKDILEELYVKTTYENRFLKEGAKIYYLAYSIN